MTEQEIKQELFRSLQFKQEDITIILLKKDDKYYSKENNNDKVIEFEKLQAVKENLIYLCKRIYGDEILAEIKEVLEKGENEGRFKYNMRKAVDMCPSANLDDKIDWTHTTTTTYFFGQPSY